MPHMHLRGKSMRFVAEYPDGRREVLLDVPRYEFDWQNLYVLDPPRPMPEGTLLHTEAHFDNSADNPNNPDPTKLVRWGEQTWNEMMIGYFDIAVPKAEAATAAEEDEKPPIPPGGVVIPERLKPLFRRFDTDGDGRLSAAEIEKMPTEVRERVYEFIRYRHE